MLEQAGADTRDISTGRDVRFSFAPSRASTPQSAPLSLTFSAARCSPPVLTRRGVLWLTAGEPARRSGTVEPRPVTLRIARQDGADRGRRSPRRVPRPRRRAGPRARFDRARISAAARASIRNASHRVPVPRRRLRRRGQVVSGPPAAPLAGCTARVDDGASWCRCRPAWGRAPRLARFPHRLPRAARRTCSTSRCRRARAGPSRPAASSRCCSAVQVLTGVVLAMY